MNRQKNAICPDHGSVLAQKQGINHILHLILTVLTSGIWGIVWAFLFFKNSTSSFRCTKCGKVVY